MRRAVFLLATASALGGAFDAARAADTPAKCQMALHGDIKVAFKHERPLIDGALDGHPIKILADTGANDSLLSRATAEALRLPADDLPGYRAYGAGGNIRAILVQVRELKLGEYAVHNLRMIAAGERRFDADMLLGQSFWGQSDMEFDFAHDRIRLLTPNRACGDVDMPYWAKTGQAYNVAPLAGGYDSRERLVVTVKLNGRPVRAELDSGAQYSIASLRVADRAGVTRREAAGSATGLGARDVRQVRGELDSFQIGDEVIKRTHLMFGDLFAGVGFVDTGSHISAGAEDAPEMLLGADFLRSHHVLVSQARHAIYFTYEGGPVFDTGDVATGEPTQPPATQAPPAPSSGP